MNGAITRETAVEAAHTAADNLALFDALSEDDAAEFVDQMLDVVVDRLRHDPRWTGISRYDPRWTGISRYDLDLMLADVRRRFIGELTRMIDDRVPAREIVREFCHALDDEPAEADAPHPI